MFGDIDLNNIKPRKPQLFLCKPNKQTISKLSEAFNLNQVVRLGDINEISFSLPYMIDVRKMLQRNPNIDLIRERYLVKVKLGDIEEYYTITSINEHSSSEDTKDIKAFSLGYTLRDKMIRNYNKIGITAKEAMTDATINTTWKLGKNLSNDEHYFNLSASSGGAGGRSFDVSSKTVLDFIIEIAEAFNAVIIWDTVNNIIDFEIPDNIGRYRGLSVSYGKYLQSLGKESNTDEMVTRLTPYGYEGLTIHGYNPTGSGYIEDFSYFMYPFERDENGNVIKSSHYMSDSLCHAILDYQELIEKNKTRFSELLKEQRDRQEELTKLETDMFSLETDMFTIQDRITAQRAIDAYQEFSIVHNLGEKNSEVVSVKQDIYKVAMIRADADTTIAINGANIDLKKNRWAIDRKDKEFNEMTIEVNALSPSANIDFIVMEVTEDDYNNATGEEIVEKYNQYNKEEQIIAKQNEIDAKRSEIDDISRQITDLQNEMSIENNFTEEQIVERDYYIIEKEITNDSLMSAEELYKFAEEEFEKIREPQMVIELDIVNFLEVVDAYKDWDKLRIGDTIRIKHERLQVDVKAKIIEINYDYEEQSISLTIANVKDIKTGEDKLIDSLYGAISTSVTVDMNKFKWDGVQKVEKDVNSILNEAWDVTKRKIQSAEGDVVWDEGGFRIISRTNPDEFLVATSGVLAITRSGGKVWEHAITTEGIIGDRLIGRIVASEKLIIENETGSFRVDKDGVTIEDAQLRLVASDGKEMNLGERFDNIENKIGNFDKRNDRIREIPRDPVVDMKIDGTLVDSIDHTVNTDGSVDISFEWDFDDSLNEGNIDGFNVYVMQGTSSAEYEFGTSPNTEQVINVPYDKRAVILYGVPANRYYTFGVQAYRIVDEDIHPDGILKSSIVKSKQSGHNPYKPESNVAFDGQITGTIGENTPAVEIEEKALGALQQGTAYNSVKIDTNSGLVAERSDGKTRTVVNATDGISVQKFEEGNWRKKFFVDTDGNINLEGNINMLGGSISWDSVGKPSYKYNEIQGAKPQTYIDSDGIYTGKISFNQAEGGTLKLGGAGNGNGVMSIRNSNNAEIIKMNQNGIELNNGATLVGNGGVLSTFVFTSGGTFGNWQEVGYISKGGVFSQYRMFLTFDIPEGFTVTSAELTVNLAPALVYGTSDGNNWNLSSTNNLYNVYIWKSTSLQGFKARYYYEPYFAHEGTKSNITTSVWGGAWTPTRNQSVQIKKSTNIKNHITNGINLIEVGSTSTNINSKAFGNITLVVRGYQN